MPGDVRVFSEFCIKQIRGEYKVRKERLKPLHAEVRKLCQEFRRIQFVWVPRENEWIARCDGMARGIVEG